MSINRQQGAAKTQAARHDRLTRATGSPSARVSKRLSTRIADEIRHSILEGHRKPGDRLASESKLAEQFGVSRIVVREAIKGLESQGLIQVKRGATGGAFVRQVSLRQLNESLYTLLRLEGFEASGLYEARLVLEPTVAMLAAQRATPLALSELERSHARAEGAWRERQPMYPALDLHCQLARMTGNPVLELLVSFITDLMETSRLLHISPIDTTPEAGQQILLHHRAIIDAVAAHDADTVGALMREHVQAISQIESTSEKRT